MVSVCQVGKRVVPHQAHSFPLCLVDVARRTTSRLAPVSDAQGGEVNSVRQYSIVFRQQRQANVPCCSLMAAVCIHLGRESARSGLIDCSLVF